METKSERISPLVAKVRRNLTLRANSLLITIYGDALAPRGQAVWLGSLIGLVDLFGLSARLVRTSAFRLTADDWFAATKIGRRSFYKLSEVGLIRVQHADRRIYEFRLPPWDGRWTLVVMDSSMRGTTRIRLKRELLWESFGQLSASVFAHPHVDHRSLQEILKAARAEELVAVLSAESIADYSRRPLQSIMHDTFRLSNVEQAWKQFIARFEPVSNGVKSLSQAETFFVRTLLIHEYRRVLLRDPNLPAALLPDQWPGLHARQLCEELYRDLLADSEQFLQTNVQTSDGALMKTPREITRRIVR